MARTIVEVGVVGLGQMGAGIAEVFARNGIAVVGVEPTEDALERGRGHLQRSTERAVQRGRLSADEQQTILDRITFTTAMADAKDCGLVIEAVPEVLSIKQAIFAELDGICGPTTILATNTSSLSVTEIAGATGRPDRVVGMHFFNPAPVMKLVEVIRTVVTDPDVVEDVVALAHRLGKTEVSITDRAGFVANALLLGYLNHAVTLLETGVVDADGLERAMTVGAGLPMGPLALLDLIGNDTVVEILDTIHRETGSRRHVAAPMLRRMVAAGRLGRKSGRGFADYGVVGPGASPLAEDSWPAPTAGARTIRRVAVIGSGPPADDLATAFASAFEVYRVSEHAIAEWNWASDSLPEHLRQVAACDLVVDLGAGDLPSAMNRFGNLDTLAPRSLLATASRTHAVTACGWALSTGRAGVVGGLRLHPPTGAGRLAEVVRGVDTDDVTTASLRAVAEALDAEVLVVPDRAGGVVDALLMPYLNDALRMVEDGYATADDVDAAMTLGCGYPIGPIALLEEIGVDVTHGVLRAMHAETGEPSLAPTPLLGRLVQAGRAGRVPSRGFRDYLAR